VLYLVLYSLVWAVKPWDPGYLEQCYAALKTLRPIWIDGGNKLMVNQSPKNLSQTSKPRLIAMNPDFLAGYTEKLAELSKSAVPWMQIARKAGKGLGLAWDAMYGLDAIRQAGNTLGQLRRGETRDALTSGLPNTLGSAYWGGSALNRLAALKTKNNRFNRLAALAGRASGKTKSLAPFAYASMAGLFN
jgi:hypothetical protein